MAKLCNALIRTNLHVVSSSNSGDDYKKPTLRRIVSKCHVSNISRVVRDKYTLYYATKTVYNNLYSSAAKLVPETCECISIETENNYSSADIAKIDTAGIIDIPFQNVRHQ